MISSSSMSAVCPLLEWGLLSAEENHIALGCSSLPGQPVSDASWIPVHSIKWVVLFLAAGGPCLQFIRKNSTSVKHNKVKYNKERYACTWTGSPDTFSLNGINKPGCPSCLVTATCPDSSADGSCFLHLCHKFWWGEDIPQFYFPVKSYMHHDLRICFPRNLNSTFGSRFQNSEGPLIFYPTGQSKL